MKKIIIILFLISTYFAKADEEMDNIELYPLSLGVSINAKYGINGVVPTSGRKSDPGLNSAPDIFLNAYLPYSESENIGLYLEAGYSSFSMKSNDIISYVSYTTSVSYLSFNPYLYLDGILLGFSYGIPLSAEFNVSDQQLDNPEIDKLEKIQNLFEVRAGYQYVFYENESSRLAATVLLSYMLNGIFNNYSDNDPYKNVFENSVSQDFNNPRLANINIGVSYLFNINY